MKKRKKKPLRVVADPVVIDAVIDEALAPAVPHELTAVIARDAVQVAPPSSTTGHGEAIDVIGFDDTRVETYLDDHSDLAALLPSRR